MNILEALVQTRNSIQSWVASNLVTKADVSHKHVISDITDLQSALVDKADTNHNHDGAYAPTIVSGTEDVTNGSASSYPDGTLYVVIE